MDKSLHSCYNKIGKLYACLSYYLFSKNDLAVSIDNNEGTGEAVDLFCKEKVSETERYQYDICR